MLYLCHILYSNLPRKVRGTAKLIICYKINSIFWFEKKQKNSILSSLFLSWFKFSTFSPATVSTLFTLPHLFTFYLYLELLITFYGNFSNITPSVFINKNLQQQFIFLLILFSFFTFSSKKKSDETLIELIVLPFFSYLKKIASFYIIFRV